MSPADLWYVLGKRSFFQNTNEKKWHHLKTLKPGSESTKIEAVRQPIWLNIRNYTFWKYYIVTFIEAFCECSHMCQILCHFY